MLAILSFANGAKGDKVMPPSFATINIVINASNAFVEVLIASLLPICDTTKEATF